MKVVYEGFGVFAILILFWMFWIQSGWYRIDCTLGVERACNLIEAEYTREAKP